MSSTCKFVSPWMRESTKVFMQIFFVVSFLCLFFFLYVVKVEKEQFETQVNYIVDNILDDFLKHINTIIPNARYRALLGEELRTIVSSWTVQTKAYAQIEENNEALLEKTKYIVINYAIILVAVLVSLFLLGFCNELGTSLFENLIIVFFIGLTEFLFLHFVASQYLAADPNKVKYIVLNTVEKFAIQKVLSGNSGPSVPINPSAPSIPSSISSQNGVWYISSTPGNLW